MKEDMRDTSSLIPLKETLSFIVNALGKGKGVLQTSKLYTLMQNGENNGRP